MIIKIQESKDVKIQKQKQANKKEIPFVAICGEDEMKLNKYTIKNMTTGEQKTCSFEELLKLIGKIED